MTYRQWLTVIGGFAAAETALIVARAAGLISWPWQAVGTPIGVAIIVFCLIVVRMARQG